MKKFVILLSVFALSIFVVGFVVIGALNNKKINILIYGLDGRNVVDEVERSDAIILANYNFETNNLVMTSIPRDSYVKITCKSNKYDKINHAYAYGGEKCLNETVSQLFGIQGIKNILIDFESIIKIVDYFGLLELTPAYSFCQTDEMNKNKYCFEKGKKVLVNGNQVLAYMRNRKSLPKGDLNRIENQRQIFKILIKKALELSLIEKINFFNFLKNNINTDVSLKDFNVKKIINVNTINLNEYTLKGEGYIDKYYYYKLDDEYLENIKKYYI